MVRGSANAAGHADGFMRFLVEGIHALLWLEVGHRFVAGTTGCTCSCC